MWSKSIKTFPKSNMIAFTLSLSINGSAPLTIDRIKKYAYLKNGAMYSIFVLGIVMSADAFGIHIPSYVSPLATFSIIGFFVFKSIRLNKLKLQELI